MYEFTVRNGIKCFREINVMCSLCKLFYYINYLEILIYNTDFINCCVHNRTYILALRYIYVYI